MPNPVVKVLCLAPRQGLQFLAQGLVGSEIDDAYKEYQGGLSDLLPTLPDRPDLGPFEKANFSWLVGFARMLEGTV